MIRFIRKTDRPQRIAATLTLGWEQRNKSRLRVILDSGEAAGLFLERGTVLRENDLIVSADGMVVRVRAARETVSTVFCADSRLMARACYHLGNRHAAVQITENRIRYPHDHVLDAMIEKLGLEVNTEQAPFDPETGAYGSGGHHHG